VRVGLLTHTPDPECTVALAARLCYSNSSIQALSEGLDAPKLITKLISMGHLSPLEHVAFTFGIEDVSRALLAQITRHRIASFSVQSQRYVDLAQFSYVVPSTIENLGQTYVDRFRSQMCQIADWYKEWGTLLAEHGYSKEEALQDARYVLPNACTTKVILTMNARELLHFFELRCCSRAQWEIRDLAWTMLDLVLPIARSIFSQAGPPCVRGHCPEGSLSCGRPSR